MTTFRRATAALALAGAALLVPCATAQAAEAAPAAPAAYQCDPSRDTDGVLVVFRDTEYGGECRAWATPEASDLSIFEINDDISSVKNRTGRDVCFYSEALTQGNSIRVHAGEWWPGLPPEMDNQISSFRPC